MGEVPTGSWGQKFRERQTKREREREEQMTAFVYESKGYGIKDEG